MQHVEIKAICKGDKITAISETHKAVKGYGKPMYLEFGKYSIQIKPESDTQDLISIMMLQEKLLLAQAK